MDFHWIESNSGEIYSSFLYILQISFSCWFWIVNGMMVGICCGGDLFMSIGGDGFQIEVSTTGDVVD